MKRVRSLAIWGVKIGCTAGLLAYLFHKIPLAEVFQSIASADIAFFVLSSAALLLMRFLAAQRMKLLASVHGIKLRAADIFEINVVSSYYGLLLPGSLAGGAVRWYKLSRHQQQGGGALAAIAFDRMSEIIAMLGLGCLFWLIDAPSSRVYPAGLGLLAAFLLFFGIVFTAFHAQGFRLMSPIRRLSRLFLAAPLAAPLRAPLEKLSAAMQQYLGLSIGFFLKIAAWSIASQLAGTFSFVWLARSLDLHAPAVAIGWIRVYAVLLTMLPISISGLGVREGALVLMLAPYGDTGANAMALSFLRLAGTLLIAGIGGLYELRRAIFHHPAAGMR